MKKLIKILEILRLVSFFEYSIKEKRYIEYFPSIFVLLAGGAKRFYFDFNEKIYNLTLNTRFDSFAFLYEVGEIPFTLLQTKKDFLRLRRENKKAFLIIFNDFFYFRINALLESLSPSYSKRSLNK